MQLHRIISHLCHGPICFLIIDEHQPEERTYDDRRNRTSFQPHKYEGKFRFFTSYSEETASLNFLKETTTIFNGNVGITINRIRTTMQNNRVSENLAFNRSKNSGQRFATDQKQVVNEYSTKTFSERTKTMPPNINSTTQGGKVSFIYLLITTGISE